MFVSADGISKPGQENFPSRVLSHSARFHVMWCNYLPQATSMTAQPFDLFV